MAIPVVLSGVRRWEDFGWYPGCVGSLGFEGVAVQCRRAGRPVQSLLRQRGVCDGTDGARGSGGGAPAPDEGR